MRKIAYDNKKQNLPIKMWLDDIEEKTMEQAINLSKLPFAFKHIAIMPDAHMGFGMPIGGVLATERVIIPNAVGSDIGCGMCAVPTPWTTKDINTEIIKKTIGKIREEIPVGIGKTGSHKIDNSNNGRLMPQVRRKEDLSKIVSREFNSACKQIGTLGGGNHFIEIQKTTNDYIWIMIHSGSRNLGYKVAKYYNELAIELNGKWFAYVPKEWDLAFLPFDSAEGIEYLREMQYCVDFALANRELMLNKIAEIFNKTIGWKKIDLKETINIAHNYASMENHFGNNVMVHRKGATLAREKTIGIIPGSQGSCSYIVKGKGNRESFMSCSHGAGRNMSRNQAKKDLVLKDEIKKMDDLGIIHGIRNQSDLDEATGAYKDIGIVMDNQKDLVEILVELKPMAVIKG